MEIIARKPSGVGIMYLLCALCGVGLAIYGITASIIPIILIGALLGVWTGTLFARYAALPSVLITVGAGGMLTLPKGVPIRAADIVDIRYNRASSRSIKYNWGSLTIKTAAESYEYFFVAECEDVAKRLTEMMYRAKYSENAM
jgi:ABC-type xylose transport system permease subunit